jgi:hypothetical protein
LYVFGFQYEDSIGQDWVAFYVKHGSSGGADRHPIPGVQWISSRRLRDEPYDRDNAWVPGDFGSLVVNYGFCGQSDFGMHLYMVEKPRRPF